jgi:hypothetical protein
MKKGGRLANPHQNNSTGDSDGNTTMSIKLPGILILALLILMPGLSMAAKPVATIDRSKVSLSESFTLNIRVAGQSIFSSPDLAPLHQDFEVLGSSKNSRYSVVNGRSESYTEWLVKLMAKSEGALVIPPIELDGEKTEALVIEVSKSPAGNSADQQAVFIETEIDKNEAYVQSQLIYTVRLYHAINLGRGASLTEPESGAAFITRLNETSYEKIIKGVRYGVFERTYAIFPQASGTLTLPPMQFSADIPTQRNNGFFDPFSARSKRLRLKGDPATINVLPKPGNYQGEDWLPANNVAIIESWSSSPLQLEVGKSVTRTIAVTANGLLSAQLPEIGSNAPEGIQVYPDQPELDDKENSSGVIGKRIESIAIIPTRAGEFTLPAVDITWWDVEENRQRIASLPAKTIKVVGGTSQSATDKPGAGLNENMPAMPALADQEQRTPDSATPAPAAGYWPWLTGLLLLAWLFSTAQWLRLRAMRRKGEMNETATDQDNSQSLKQALRAVEAACGTNDARAARGALLDWANTRWPDKNIYSLGAIKALANNETFATELDALEGALFSSAAQSSGWDGKALLEAVKALPSGYDKNAGSKQSGLPPLYKLKKA